MRAWEITTSRQQVDTTTLGEEFVTKFSRGLISGQALQLVSAGLQARHL